MNMFLVWTQKIITIIVIIIITIIIIFLMKVSLGGTTAQGCKTIHTSGFDYWPATHCRVALKPSSNCNTTGLM